MAVIEALANAVPAICTPVGALPDYLVDGPLGAVRGAGRRPELGDGA